MSIRISVCLTGTTTNVSTEAHSERDDSGARVMVVRLSDGDSDIDIFTRSFERLEELHDAIGALIETERAAAAAWHARKHVTAGTT